MPKVTALKFMHRLYCRLVSILIVFTISVGPLAAVASPTGMDAITEPIQEIAQENCPSESPGGGAVVSCDSDRETPSKRSPCQMMRLCVTMTSGGMHCAPLALTEVTCPPGETFGLAAVGYIRADIRASGLPAEPLFHPPIL